MREVTGVPRNFTTGLRQWVTDKNMLSTTLIWGSHMLSSGRATLIANAFRGHSWHGTTTCFPTLET